MTVYDPDFTRLCKEAEFFETPDWAAEKILEVELLTHRVLDPCAGRGVLGTAARDEGYDVLELDLNDWPGKLPGASVTPGINFLARGAVEAALARQWGSERLHGRTVLMNPPFSLACDFVERSLQLGARKVVMFQRMAFLESQSRRDFFSRTPPARIWICGDRATCWRGDIPEETIRDAGGNIIVKGRRGGSSPTPHAWFVWEKGHRGAMNIQHIFKD